ncbi:hypothetical protein VTN02DRAFT_5966 [Thermoascus thermophilus]
MRVREALALVDSNEMATTKFVDRDAASAREVRGVLPQRAQEPPFVRSTPGGIGMPSERLAIAFGMPWGIQALHHDDVPSPAPAIKPYSPPPHPPHPSTPS